MRLIDYCDDVVAGREACDVFARCEDYAGTVRAGDYGGFEREGVGTAGDQDIARL